MRLQVGLVICTLLLPGMALAQMSATATVSVAVIESVGIAGPAQLSTSETQRPGRTGNWSATASYELVGRDQQVVSVDSSDTLSARHVDGDVLVIGLSQGQTVGSRGLHADQRAMTDRVVIAGAGPISANANPGLYTGDFRMVANYN